MKITTLKFCKTKRNISESIALNDYDKGKYGEWSARFKDCFWKDSENYADSLQIHSTRFHFWFHHVFLELILKVVTTMHPPSLCVFQVCHISDRIVCLSLLKSCRCNEHKDWKYWIKIQLTSLATPLRKSE